MATTARIERTARAMAEAVGAHLVNDGSEGEQDYFRTMAKAALRAVDDHDAMQTSAPASPASEVKIVISGNLGDLSPDELRELMKGASRA